MSYQYSCPLCQSQLHAQEKSLVCVNNHSFDRAKEGYYNLLPVQYKHSKNPGDNKAMVNARRAFLDKGYYQQLVDKMLDIYQNLGNTAGVVFDAGCGEGFYTHQHKTDHNQVYGIDISKEAIKKAAKRYKACHFSVGTLSKLPFFEHSIDWIINVYAPIIESEYTRVLTSGGYLLTVTPARNHLHELKQKIYREALQHDDEKLPIKALPLIEQHQLTYNMDIEQGDDALHLLEMTPFAFKATQEVKDSLANLVNFQCQADFLIRVYKKP
ncbi:23S rRNA (guanine(745)-N(1))-methyltransferase [Thalassotalea sp. LPB0316]|uniref:23S rRNA (guanine(745)-N(1))-methyltransferase n=1 Tax=Thalassotalea sp. LPB0316 TaxID=2769490 RepID=UPI0018665809|nr:23S rRNA (guanine(745)-N(1))-methyltransferase [Thalassotalea sp. LPB0316]QOL25168.1 23S rRNA (guanine(745)-N(1))-methyltransferase [Thalassotalea sp. LPB0316]